VINNQNVESISAIDDYLIAINRLFDELLFDRYPNPTLMKYKPFTSLSFEVQEGLNKAGVVLRAKEVNPAISKEQFEFIIQYLNNYKGTGIKSNQVKIIVKLMLLYGFSHDKIAAFKISDYNANHKTLKVRYKRVMNRDIRLEMPYSLAMDVDEYLSARKRFDELNSDLLFVTKNNTEITNAFTKKFLDLIKDEYIKIDGGNFYKNQFTPTGLQKYAVIQMILNGMNQSVIMDFTGQEENIYNDCQNEVNRIKELDRNRYVNHMLRGIDTYDKI
jgi:integrase